MKKLMKSYGLRKSGGKQKGFTLVELLIVLTILAILVAVVTLALTSFIGKGESEACEADKDALQIAALSYYHETGGWPASYAVMIPQYIDKVPDSDADSDFGISEVAATNGLICFGASAAVVLADCDCLETTDVAGTDYIACTVGSVIDLLAPAP